MLGPECKYLNGPEISFRTEAVFAACRLVGHIWDSTHIASNHLSVGQDLSANELIFVSTWFPGKRGWIWLKSSHTFVRLEAASRNVNDQQMETWSPGEVWTPTARCWCWWWASFIFWSFFSYGTMCSNQSTMAVQFPSRTIMTLSPWRDVPPGSCWRQRGRTCRCGSSWWRWPTQGRGFRSRWRNICGKRCSEIGVGGWWMKEA